jgi:anti-sigma28 factor (negative regulator of flagellin synthesis)
MVIPPEFRPTDPTVKRRQAELVARSDKTGEGKPTADATTSSDSAKVGSGLDPAAVGRFVEILKTMNPLDLHKVEDLRQRIADGRYKAEPDELADLLLGDEPRPGDAPRGPRPGA